MTKDFTQKDLFSVAEEIRNGKVVAFPTDTVYGVGVRYDDEQAIARMKWCKGRPEEKPFPMMEDLRQCYYKVKNGKEGIALRS